MTTRRTTPNPPPPQDPADAEADLAEASALELDPMQRYEHENWGDAIKEAAMAHLAMGRSMRSTARILGVPHSTLQSWKLSQDPAAKQLRAEKVAEILDLVWETSAELIVKTRNAPVGSARDGAIAFAALTEGGIQLSHMATVVNKDNSPFYAADWVPKLKEEHAEAVRLRATVVVPKPKPE